MENKALSEQIKKEGTPDVIIIQDEDGHVTQKMIDLKTTNKKVLVAGRKEDPKIQRNEPCPCGSSKKYKHCCINVQA